MSKRTTSATARHPTSDLNTGDEFLAAVLIRMWALASGRTLRSDVPPNELGEEELIAFWADDMTTTRAGRHARSEDPDDVPDGLYAERQDVGAPQARRRKRRPPHGDSASRRRELPADPAAA